MINHALLKRQLKKANLSVVILPEKLEDWKFFLNLVNKIYLDTDQDHYTTERSMEISSLEMQEINNKLKVEVQETHKQENLLQEEKYFLDELLDGVPGFFYFFDEQGYAIRWNKEVEHVCGYSAEELSKIHVLDFFQENDRNRVGNFLQKIFLHGWGTFEAKLVCKDQSKIPCFFSGRQINYKGKKCIIGIAYDISERKAVEDKLIGQLEELHRWHAVTLAREGRILELKHEVNQLLIQNGQPLRYPSAEPDKVKEKS